MGIKYGYNSYMGSAAAGYHPEKFLGGKSKYTNKRRNLHKNSFDTFTSTLKNKEKRQTLAKKAVSFIAKAAAFAGVAVILKNSKCFNNLLKPVSEGLDKFLGKFSKNNKIAQSAGEQVQKSGIFNKIGSSLKSTVTGLFKKNKA